MAIEILSTTIKPAGGDDMRVEILLSDNANIEHAGEVMSLAVRVPRQGENPSLDDIRRAALRRARTAIDECIAALAPHQPI